MISRQKTMLQQKEKILPFSCYLQTGILTAECCLIYMTKQITSHILIKHEKDLPRHLQPTKPSIEYTNLQLNYSNENLADIYNQIQREEGCDT